MSRKPIGGLKPGFFILALTLLISTYMLSSVSGATLNQPCPGAWSQWERLSQKEHNFIIKEAAIAGSMTGKDFMVCRLTQGKYHHYELVFDSLDFGPQFVLSLASQRVQ